jgi:hypothetical protein
MFALIIAIGLTALVASIWLVVVAANGRPMHHQ